MSGGNFTSTITSRQRMLSPGDLVTFRTRCYHESGALSCTLYHRNSFQTSVSGLSSVQQVWSSGFKDFVRNWDEGNMHRVVSRHRALKFNQFLLAGLQPGDVAAHASCGLRSLELTRNPALQSMESSAHKALVGNARLLDSLVGWKGGSSAVRILSNAPCGRPVVPRRSFREDRKLIPHKSRQHSSRIESTNEFTAQRLLECAVDVLRNFNEKVTNLRSRWGGDTGSRNCTAAAEEQHPLSADTVVRENAAPELGEAASSEKPTGGEFEWRSALWEAEVSTLGELEAVSHGGLISLGTDGGISQMNGSDVPQSSLSEAEVETRADERMEDTETAAGSNPELERLQSRNAVVNGVQASDGASSIEVEQVDIGELWNKRNGSYASVAGSDTSLSLEPGPWTSLEIIEPLAREIERDEGQPIIDQAGQSAVEGPASITELQPRSSVLNVEVEFEVAPAIDRTDVKFNIQEQAGQRSELEPASILGQQAPSAFGDTPQILGRNETQSSIEEQAAQQPESGPSTIFEPQPDIFRTHRQPEIAEYSAHDVERGFKDSSFSEHIESPIEQHAHSPIEQHPESRIDDHTQSPIEEQAGQSDPRPSSILEESSSLEPAGRNGDSKLSSVLELQHPNILRNVEGQVTASEIEKSASQSVFQERESHYSSRETEEGIEIHSNLGKGHSKPYPGRLEGLENSFGGQAVPEEGGLLIKKNGEIEPEVGERTRQNESSLEGLFLEQDSQTAAFGAPTLTGEGSVIEEERLVLSDQERTSEDFEEPFREHGTDDPKVTSGGQLLAELSIDYDSSNDRGEIQADLTVYSDLPADKDTGGMDNQDIRQDINKLRRSVSHHAYMYYTLDTPVISDATYDALVKDLDNLELQASYSEPSQDSLVGAQPSPDMLKVLHSVPMLSLASVQKEVEVQSWHHRLQQKLGSAHGSVGWVVEPKVDGLALSIIYENGQLKCAATRGDGERGEDVTHNAQRVLGIPLTIPCRVPGTKNLLILLEVRGEIFMSLQHFKELNAAKLRAGVKPMANPRNAAAGSMRLLNSMRMSELRTLSFMAYSISNIEVSTVEEDAENSVQKPKNQWQALQLLESIGFAVNKDNQFFESFDSALEYAKSWRSTRKMLEYEADGAVLKVNDLATQASLGSVGGDPRWAIAWKFAPTEAVSVLEGIELTVGRSGAIIPNARFKPVELGGAVISRASLHNIGHVKALGLCEGDHIVIQRAGDVIPQVIQVLEDLRPETAKPWSPPQECPFCGSRLTEASAGTMVFCSNSTCGSRHSRQVAHFAKTLIPGLGSATLSQLEDEALVKDRGDFYDLDEQALSNLRGFGKVSVTKLLKAIEESKHQDLWLYIFALGIPRVGMNTAKELAETFGSLQALLKSDTASLTTVPGIGTSTAACIFDWCQCEPNIELIQRLEVAGCKINLYNDNESLVSPPSEEDGVLNGPAAVQALGLSNESGEETDIVVHEDLKKVTNDSRGKPNDLNESDDTLVMVTPQPATPKLQGKVVVVTGDFGTMLRKDMKNLVTEHGGIVRTSVTSKTSFVLCGNRPGPIKISEATRRGIEILDWDSFLRLIGQPSKDIA